MNKHELASLLTANALASMPEEWYLRAALAMYRSGRSVFIGPPDSDEVHIARFWLSIPSRSDIKSTLFDTENSALLQLYLCDTREQCLHDNPWDFTTTVLAGEMIEHLPPPAWLLDKDVGRNVGGPEWNAYHEHHLPGARIHRLAEDLHCIGSAAPGTWTLIHTGRERHDWGYYPPGQKWVPWHEHVGVSA